MRSFVAGNTEELLLKIRELEKEVARWKSQVKEQRYGLNWIDVPEAFDKESENSIPILEEVPEKAIKNDDGKPTHILIEGDNYHALTCLNYTHKGKIDVIYIDPPYNTGSDGFTYKDKRILDKYPDGTAVPKDSPLRHSYWLSFMSKRLELAKKLMKETGAIFISINEDEYSQLKLLCDQIFGPQNYITSFTIKVRHEDRILKGDKPIHETTEMLLFYQKSDKYVIQKRIKDTSTPDGYEYKVTELKSADEIIELGGKQVEVFRPSSYKVEKVSADFSNLKMINIRGSIKAGNSSGRFHMSYLEPRKNEFSVLYKVPNMGDDGLGYRYFISRKNEKQLNGSYFQGAPVNRQDSTEIPYPNFFDFEQAFNDVGGEGGVPFDGGKKPIEFIQNFLKIANGKDELTILDFFGGSGSTGHAVIDCNKKHKFILVQTPDLTYELVHGKKLRKKGLKTFLTLAMNELLTSLIKEKKMSSRVIQTPRASSFPVLVIVLNIIVRPSLANIAVRTLLIPTRWNSLQKQVVLSPSPSKLWKQFLLKRIAKISSSYTAMTKIVTQLSTSTAITTSLINL